MGTKRIRAGKVGLTAGGERLIKGKRSPGGNPGEA